MDEREMKQTPAQRLMTICQDQGELTMEQRIEQVAGTYDTLRKQVEEGKELRQKVLDLVDHLLETPSLEYGTRCGIARSLERLCGRSPRIVEDAIVSYPNSDDE